MAWPCRDRAWQAPREGAWPPLGCPGCRAGSDFSHVALGQPLGQTTSIRRLEVFTVCHDPLVRGVVMSARPKDMGRISHLMDLPTCGLHRLGEIAELVASVRLSPIRKRKLALALRKKGYIPKLLHLFQVCERVKNTKGLHLLFDIVRGILYLGKNILFEVLFSDECILGVAGCLEYDPSLAQPGWHRELLTKTAKRQEVIPIRDPELREKVRQTSRAQYIYDIIVPNSSDFEVGFLSTLNSFISSSKEEILEALQKDKEFLPDVFAQLRNEATAGEQQCELLKFFKEFCAFSCTSPEKRDELLQTLAKLGFLPILEMLLGVDNQQVRSAAADILFYLVEFCPATIQQFVMQEAQQSKNDTQLITVIIEQIICHPDPEFGGNNQLTEALCALIDPEKMPATASNLEVFEFLDIFYDRYIDVLTAPLPADTSEEWYDIDNYRTAEILASVLELLSFCVERHKYHMKVFILKKDLLRRTLVLMKSKHKFLALTALRFMRRIIGLKDEIYNRYITLGNLLEPVVSAVLDNRSKCNLLKSASMELLEFIQKEDIQFLIAHIVENFSDALESVKYIHTFQGLKAKHEQAKGQQNKKLNSVPFILPGETHAKEAVVSQVDEGVLFSRGEEKAAPTSPANCNGSYPTYRTGTTVETALKVGENFYGSSCPHVGQQRSLMELYWV
ncbi:serine/threonine-protein phosphatase 4 regulatory subunit 3B-like [Anomalospiza imberbis]|uniref:serine/threonine-protein phosphatase 4 regulatory subunit 3B-like n=1 Tax=Anomalospiza imberbis TaxID=187417 RepID=UPI0035900998